MPISPPPPTDLAILERIQRSRLLFWIINHWYPSGMLPTTLYGTGSATFNQHVLTLATGTTAASYAFTQNDHALYGSTWSKKRYFLVQCLLTSVTNVDAWIAMAPLLPTPPGGNPAREHIGFHVSGSTLIGTVGNGTAETTLTLMTIAANTLYTLEAILTPGVECRFYVDGVDKGAISSGLPSGTSNAQYWFFAYIYNTAAEDKRLSIQTYKAFQQV